MSSTVANHGFHIASLGLGARDAVGLARSLRKGLPFDALARLQRESSLPSGRIARFLQLPSRTLARRKSAGRLRPDEAERLVRLALIFEKAQALFEGDGRAAADWLQAPLRALGNQAPLDVAESEIGTREVEDLIGRLEHGVFA